jgi:hypothetical protein
LQLAMCKVSSPCHYETRLAASDVKGKQHKPSQKNSRNASKNDEEFFSISVFLGRPKAKLSMIVD